MTIAEIEERLEKLPAEIFEAEKKYLNAKAEYEKICDAFDIQLAIEKVRVQKDSTIPNNFAKDKALTTDIMQDLMFKKTHARIRMVKWQAVYNKLDREFKAVRKIATLKTEEINRGV